MELITFKALEKLNNIKFDECNSNNSSLDDWYARVCNKPLSEFGESDIGISLRQELFVEYTIPLALKLLIQQPLSGGKYEGELITVLSAMKLKNWAQSELGLSLVKALSKKSIIEECKAEGCEDERVLLVSKLC